MKKPMTFNQASKKAFKMFPTGYVDVYFNRKRYSKSDEIVNECTVYNGTYVESFTGPTFENVFLEIEKYLLIKDQKKSTKAEAEQITEGIVE